MGPATPTPGPQLPGACEGAAECSFIQHADSNSAVVGGVVLIHRLSYTGDWLNSNTHPKEILGRSWDGVQEQDPASPHEDPEVLSSLGLITLSPTSKFNGASFICPSQRRGEPAESSAPETRSTHPLLGPSAANHPSLRRGAASLR